MEIFPRHPRDLREVFYVTAEKTRNTILIWFCFTKTPGVYCKTHSTFLLDTTRVFEKYRKDSAGILYLANDNFNYLSRQRN
jgi:hypothetical protein